MIGVRQLNLRGYSHQTRVDGAAVVKQFTGPQAVIRCATERAALTNLAGRLPVPRLLAAGDTLLRTALLPGVHGQELIENGHAAPVLASCGRMLRHLQHVVPGLVHGDYGPNNLLFDPDTFEVTGIVDWEWAHPGAPVEDLAWTEWIIRRHHPDDVAALTHLFTAYGETPVWELRHAVGLAKCRAMRDRPDNDPADAAHWQRNIAITAAWTA
ncbi:phosphotransferase [Actinoplanes sichuanensis]|uniref:Phosphotransferase n=1 Tax=Actinoplanes sichuanensis TaxID=512349 RepID=A0ABW4AS55_9ACTN|nr:phosphotransferase [Actinoplanes sichuanensis]